MGHASAQKGFDSAKDIAAIADLSVAAAEIGVVAAITRQVANSGVNGRADIRANRWTSFPTANALSKSKALQALRTAGAGLFVFGSSVSLIHGAQAFRRGDSFGVGKSAVDVGFGAAGFFGGSVGAVGAITYGGASAIINFVPGAYNYSVGPIVDAACSMSGDC